MDVLLKILTLAFLVTMVTAFSRQTYSCDWVSDPRVNCSVDRSPRLCGSDRKTYANRCTISQAHCRDTSLYIRHEGHCRNAPNVTCPDSYVLVHGHGCVHVDTAPDHGSQIRDDFFCRELSHRNCPTGHFPVCTSSGITLENMCEFEKYRCTHRHVKPASLSACTT